MNAEARRQLLIAEIEDLSALITEDGYMTVGSKGQPVAHPAIGLRHAALEALRRLEATMPPDDGPSALDAFLTANAGT